MNSQITELYTFLRSCRGSWRETIYIECRCCPYGNPACSGYLLTTDRDDAPHLFSTNRFSQLTGDSVDKEECAAVLSRHLNVCIPAGWPGEWITQGNAAFGSWKNCQHRIVRIKSVFKPYWR